METIGPMETDIEATTERTTGPSYMDEIERGGDDLDTTPSSSPTDSLDFQLMVRP